MRNIENKKDSKLNKKILVIALIVLMASSTIGFIIGFGQNNNPKDEKLNYNGIDFVVNQNGLWEFKINGNVFSTVYNPYELGEIPLNITISSRDLLNKPLYYVVENANNLNAINEIIRNINVFIQRSQEVCLNAEFCRNKDLILKDCSNNIIILKNSKDIKIYKDQNCIFIESPLEDQLKIGDKLIFKIAGV
ncbi:MAG: hypothetical protein AABY07_10365 [Nanoarchaeota archaeon]|mgnify:CR=1 FL=1